jgi:hypothetical protein
MQKKREICKHIQWYHLENKTGEFNNNNKKCLEKKRSSQDRKGDRQTSPLWQTPTLSAAPIHATLAQILIVSMADFRFSHLMSFSWFPGVQATRQSPYATCLPEFDTIGVAADVAFGVNQVAERG